MEMERSILKGECVVKIGIGSDIEMVVYERYTKNAPLGEVILKMTNDQFDKLSASFCKKTNTDEEA